MFLQIPKEEFMENNPGGRKTYRRPIKTAAFAVNLLFVSAQVLPASSLALRPETTQLSQISAHDLEIPKKIGRIEKYLKNTPAGGHIVILQDAHAVHDAQINIEKLLNHLSRLNFKTIGLEGGSGVLDTLLLKTFPDNFIKRKVLQSYFKRGELTGAEMAAISDTGNNLYFGMEEWALYRKNYKHYSEAAENQAEILKKISEKEAALALECKKICSPELLELLKNSGEFEDRKMPLDEYVDYLASRAVKMGNIISSKDRPHLYSFLNAVRTKAPDESEVKAWFESFKQKTYAALPPAAQRKWNSSEQDWRTGAIDSGQLIMDLKKIVRGTDLPLSLPPNLQSFYGRIRELYALKGTRLFDEIADLTGLIEKQTAKTPGELSAVNSFREFRRLKSLALLELTQDEWKSMTLPNDPGFKPAVEFYKAAEERNAAFLESTLKALEKQKDKRAVLVVGGFHTQGLEKLFHENGFSVTTVTPVIRSLHGQESYPELMKGNFSWKKHFKGDFYDAFSRDSAEKLMKRVELPHREEILTRWRTILWHALAFQNRLGKSSEYTQYMDHALTSFDEDGEASAPKDTPGSDEIIARALTGALVPGVLPALIPANPGARSETRVTPLPDSYETLSKRFPRESDETVLHPGKEGLFHGGVKIGHQLKDYIYRAIGPTGTTTGKIFKFNPARAHYTLNEARIIRFLNRSGMTKGVPTLVGIGLTPETRPWIALDGIESAQSFQDYPFESLEEILAAFIKISVIFKKIHQLGIIHTDPKPANFLVNAEGEVQLIDFESAVRTDRKRRPFLKLSTHPYAPFDATGKVLIEHATKKTDAFSLLVSFAEVLGQFAIRQKHGDERKQIKNLADSYLQQIYTQWDFSPGKSFSATLTQDIYFGIAVQRSRADWPSINNLIRQFRKDLAHLQNRSEIREPSLSNFDSEKIALIQNRVEKAVRKFETSLPEGRKFNLAITYPSGPEAAVIEEVVGLLSGMIERLEILYPDSTRPKNFRRGAWQGIKSVGLQKISAGKPEQAVDGLEKRNEGNLVYALTESGVLAPGLLTDLRAIEFEIRALADPRLQKLAYTAAILLLFRISEFSKEERGRLKNAESFKAFLEADPEFSILTGWFTPDNDGRLKLNLTNLLSSFAAIQAAERSA